MSQCKLILAMLWSLLRYLSASLPASFGAIWILISGYPFTSVAALPAAASYTWFCNKLLESVSHFGVAGTVGSVPGSYCNGGYNIVVSGKKLMGTSQRCVPISRDYQEVALLMHATVLVSADKERLCNIVNSFNAFTEQEAVVSENALVTLAEVYSWGGKENIKETLVDALVEAFHPSVNTWEYPVSNC